MTHPRNVFAGCLCLALVALIGAAPSTQPSDVEKENAELRKRVAALEGQVKSLEDEVARLKRREGSLTIPRLPQAPPTLPQAPQMPFRYDRVPQPMTPPQAPQQPGREWIPREFNGRTVYIVPCTPDADAAPAGR